MTKNDVSTINTETNISSPLPCEEVLNSLRMAIAIINNTADNCYDDENAQYALQASLEKLVCVEEKLKSVEQEELSENRAYSGWYNAPAEPKGNTHFEDWNPEIISFVEQAADRIGELSRDFAKEKMTRLVAEKVNGNSVKEVLSIVKNWTYSARPLLMEHHELDSITGLLEFNRKTLDEMIDSFKKLEAEHIPQGKLGFNEERLAELSKS